MVRRLRILLTAAAAVGSGWFLVAAANDALTDSVSVEGGVVKGATSDGVRVFKGIPYASPPVGDFRWKAPGPVVAWNGVRDAVEYGAQCPQIPYPRDSPYYAPPRKESEDCLFLNVWTAAEAGAKGPVMVWIHGGGLTRGTGATATYDGAPLAKKGVVVVTINYRIGPLGYLAHPELTAESPQHSSGNYGVLDQIAALKWVRKNIAAFGGDSSRVTIFGESAGSTSVNVLMATPLAKGLFERAIGESGGRFGRGVRLSEAEQAGVAFVKAVGVDSGVDSMKALRAISPQKLLAVANFRTQENVDGWVLPDEIRPIFEQKKHNHVPVIVGSNANEMTTLATQGTAPKTLEDYRKRVVAQYGDAIKEFDTLYPANSDADVRDAWLGSLRDAGMTLQMRTWARLTTAGGDRAYLYWFSHVAPHPRAKELRAYHASEIAYVFGNLIRDWSYTAVDRQVAETMSSYWSNFAITGDPNGRGLPTWSPYDAQTEPYLDFGDSSVLRNHLRKAEVDFFERFQSRSQRTTSSERR